MNDSHDPLKGALWASAHAEHRHTPMGGFIAGDSARPLVSASVPPPSESPGRRIWLRFKAQRLGYWSLIVFAALFVISLLGEVLANDKPLIVRYEGHYYFPVVKDYSETVFGGDFPARANYLDPYIRNRPESKGNFAIYPPDHFHYDTVDYFANLPNPAPPSAANWIGTDQFGHDVLSRLLYGFRLSVLMAMALTVSGGCWAFWRARCRLFTAAVPI